MSTTVDVEDPQALQEAVGRVRADTGETTRRAWVLGKFAFQGY